MLYKSIIVFLFLASCCHSLIRITSHDINRPSFLTISSSHQQDRSTATTSNNDSRSPMGLYVHIPFCRRRCRYCNFAIVPVGETGVEYLSDDYTDALLAELQKLSIDRDKGSISLQSVYFGGGTPSLAPIEMFEKIFAYIRSKHSPFALEPSAEITIEIDPGTFTIAKLKGLKDLGFNRLSFGVQSFNDTILESLGRNHRRKDVIESLEWMRQVYGDDVNYSIDLISSLPGLSLAGWISTLETASTLSPRPSHMSLYDLQIESGTVFDKWYTNEDLNSIRTSRTGILPLPSEEVSAFMYKYAAGYLRSKGYQHYEVSSYARDGKRSHHNQIYWATNGQWHAIGLGATSFVDRRLVSRPRALSDYLKWAKEQRGALDNEGIVNDLDLLMDVTLKRLRTQEGLSLEWVRSTFEKGEYYYESILRGASLGLEMGLVSIDDGILRLKDPDGFLYSNSIISSIFAEWEET